LRADGKQRHHGLLDQESSVTKTSSTLRTAMTENEIYLGCASKDTQCHLRWDLADACEILGSIGDAFVHKLWVKMFGLIINVNILSKEMNRNMANGVRSELRMHIPRLTERVGCPVGWNLQPWVQDWETVERF
jgi:hypothetical protein